MDKTESLIKKTRKRSVMYPAFNLGDVVEASKVIKDKLGDGPYSREHMAIALGYKAVTGSSATKISACVHFGLIERNGSAYVQSELANRLFNYLNDAERKQTLIEAFGRPALYQKLLTEYEGKSLPLMLESILVRNYGIQEGAARSAAMNFKESAELVGILKNGVISTSQEAGEASKVSRSTTAAEAANPHAPERLDNLDTPVMKSGYLSVTLPSGLIVNYSDELASAFAFGIFGQKLMDLDKAIMDYRNTLRIDEDKTAELLSEQVEVSASR